MVRRIKITHSLILLLIALLTAESVWSGASARGSTAATVIAAASYKGCGTVGNTADTGAAVVIRASRVSCRYARSFAKRCVDHGRMPRGWHSRRTGRILRNGGNTPEYLYWRGKKRIRFGYVGGSNGCNI